MVLVAKIRLDFGYATALLGNYIPSSAGATFVLSK